MIDPHYIAPYYVICIAGAISFLFMWALLKYEYVKDRTRQYFKPIKSKWTWIIVVPLSLLALFWNDGVWGSGFMF